MLSIRHVVASVKEEASGPSYSVPRLCSALGRIGHEVELLTVGQTPRLEDRGGYVHRICRQSFWHVPILSRLISSAELKRELLAGRPDVFHVHGLWLMPNVYPSRVSRKNEVPVILSPRGMLGPKALTYSKWRKQVFWNMAQRLSVERASCIHATSEQELQDIRAFGLGQPVAIIPNGVDLPNDLAGPAERHQIVLFLGRIHPKKGVDRLIEAWGTLERRHPEWALEIGGPLEGAYAESLKAMVARAGLQRVRFLGPLYGGAKTAAYRRASLFVLPTLDDNFALTVSEALAHELPVIVTKGAPWQGVVKHRCGWWIDHGCGPLAFALENAMTLPADRLHVMGKAGRDWMAQEFTWTTIAESMLDLYDWVRGCSVCPAFVHL